MKSVKILLVITACLSLIVGCGNKNKESKEKNTNNNTVAENKTVIAESFEFKTNSVNFENNNSVFDINIKNIADESRYIKEFMIHVKDAKGETLANLFGYVNETIEAQGEKVISCSYGGDLSNYSTLEFEVLK